MSQKKSKHVAARRTAARPRAIPYVALGGAAIIVGALLLLASCGAPAAQAPVEVTGAPSLKADKEKVDLGNVRLGEWVNVSFEIANVGDQPLVFTEEPFVQVVEGC